MKDKIHPTYYPECKVTFRGEVVIDQMLQATTNVNELEGACD